MMTKITSQDDDDEEKYWILILFTHVNVYHMAFDCSKFRGCERAKQDSAAKLKLNEKKFGCWQQVLLILRSRSEL